MRELETNELQLVSAGIYACSVHDADNVIERVANALAN